MEAPEAPDFFAPKNFNDGSSFAKAANENRVSSFRGFSEAGYAFMRQCTIRSE
jgi:hypothetical protein